MTGQQRANSETDQLVQEIKAEMISDGSRYVESSNKYRRYSANGKVITPMFGNLYSSLCKSEPKKEQLDDGIQFRGIPKVPDNPAHPMLIKLNHDAPIILKELK